MAHASDQTEWTPLAARHHANGATRDLCQAVNATFDVDMASAVWPQYDDVAFGDPAELRSRVERFLTHPQGRRDVAMATRGPVIEHASHRRISTGLLDLIGDRMRPARRAAA